MAPFTCPKQFYCLNRLIRGGSKGFRVVRIFSAPTPFLAPFFKMSGLVPPTFFLWEITQKFFSQHGVFISWQLKKLIFVILGVPTWPWRPLSFWDKKGYFGPNSHENQSLLAFKDLYLVSMTSKQFRYSKKRV